MKPTILLVTSCRWFATARIAIAFAEAGCQVNIVCPKGHPVVKASIVDRMFVYHGLHPVPGLSKAIENIKPSLLVPCDDRATLDLLSLRAQTNSPVVKQSITHALGDPGNYTALTARSVFMRIAHEAGVCVPETQEVDSLSTLQHWLSAHEFPAYLKADGTSGGVGVMKIQDIREAERALAQLSTPPAAIRMAKRLIVDRDTSFVLPFVRRTHSTVNVQKLVSGVETNSAVSCWQGKVISCVHVQVLERRDSTGHATVVRVIENQQMQDAAEKVARRLGLSGLFGLDYIVEQSSGQAYLLEINARATQTCHLALGPGRSPIAALAAMMCGKPVNEIPAVTNQETIALFPQEWKRNPASAYLQSTFHDVPWAYPELIRSSVKWRLHEQDAFSYQKWLQRRRSTKKASN